MQSREVHVRPQLLGRGRRNERRMPHFKRKTPLDSRLSVERAAPLVAAVAEAERREVEREGNVERNARRRARRPADFEIRPEFEGWTIRGTDPDAASVGIDQLKGEGVPLIGLGPRNLEDKCDCGGRLRVGDVPAAAQNEQLATLHLGRIGEHHRAAGAAGSIVFTHRFSITRWVNASVPSEGAPSRARSRVLAPDAMADATAFSMRAALASSLSEWRQSKAADKIAAIGLAIPFPAVAGALPLIGSYRPKRPPSLAAALPKVALGRLPSEPVSIAASSERMSPKVFSVKITSKRCGSRISCIAAVSTSRCSSSISGYSACSATTTRRHSRLVSRTFCLSTEVTRRRRARASSNATRALRSISGLR